MYITQLFLIVHGKNVNINISYSVHEATVIIIFLYGINFIFQSYDFIKDFSIHFRLRYDTDFFLSNSRYSLLNSIFN